MTADPATWPLWLLVAIGAACVLALVVQVPERIADWLFPRDRRG